ncbi:MAG: type IV secretion system protein [Rickettsiales bacterium]|nr:type IV secretion system protein [Rickettsiales bacterium]
MLGKLFKQGRNEAGSETKNWYKDKYQYVLVQRNILAVTTLTALFCSAAAVFAVMQLTPHKSVEPFVIQIDEKTGIVQRVDPVTRTEFTSNESVDRFFVANYIRSRETYIRQVFRYNYDIVRVMSDRYTFGQYLNYVSERNEESPAAILKSGGQRSVKFKSISFIKRSDSQMRAEKVVQARIILRDVSRKFPAPIEYHNIVTMTFQYSNLNLNEEERFMNPLGFLVTEYAIEREVVK